MKIVVLDFETYFDDVYSLDKMTTESYVRDPRFEAHGAGIRLPDGATCWYPAAQLPGLFASIPWRETALLCHHAHFDGLILNHRYGVTPAFWLDTLPMGRGLVSGHISASLESLAGHFKLGAKNVPYNLFKGRHWLELEPYVRELVANGCLHDVALTWNLFLQLARDFPTSEYTLVDATVRMFTEPVLEGDTGALAVIWQKEAAAKAGLLASVGADGTAIRGNESFAALLRGAGVFLPERTQVDDECCLESGEAAPGWKPGKSGPIYAFAKTDDFMRDLQEDVDSRVAALAEARIAEKSNITQTRCGRLGYMSTRGPMCVYLSYARALTTRWAGGDSLNWQNFPRESTLGEAIVAPAGHVVVVNDASQIECRILNKVAGQDDVIARFERREDPYIGIASMFYNEPIYKPAKDDPRRHEMETKRGTGKQLELSCGYGAGGPTIQATAKKGTYGPPVYITEGDALRARDLYRATHPRVVGLWNQGAEILKMIYSGMSFTWGCLEIRNRRVYLPNGLPIIYESLHRRQNAKTGREDWFVRTREGYAKMYGAKFIENIIQALARVHVADAGLACINSGIRMVSMEHDKWIAVVRESEGEAVLAYMATEMCRVPSWLPGLPLDSEGYISHRFAKGF